MVISKVKSPDCVLADLAKGSTERGTSIFVVILLPPALVSHGRRPLEHAQQHVKMVNQRQDSHSLARVEPSASPTAPRLIPRYSVATRFFILQRYLIYMSFGTSRELTLSTNLSLLTELDYVYTMNLFQIKYLNWSDVGCLLSCGSSTLN